MTHSDRAPSSIRDDSICEPSLNPNKSSGDIGDRLLKRLRRKTIQTGVDLDNGDVPVFALDPDCQDAAAEIERLRREKSAGFAFWRKIATVFNDRAKTERARRLTAESAVAAAYENAAKIAENLRFAILPDQINKWELAEAQRRAIASAIRAAGGENPK